MTILIYAIKSTGENKLIAVAPDHLLDKVQEYCAGRNKASIEAGYNTSYKYDRTDATMIEDETDLEFESRVKVTEATKAERDKNFLELQRFSL